MFALSFAPLCCCFASNRKVRRATQRMNSCRLLNQNGAAAGTLDGDATAGQVIASGSNSEMMYQQLQDGNSCPSRI
jgi:hypothetical protein